MPCRCKGLCTRFKAKRKNSKATRYGNDQVRCSVCAIYLIKEGAKLSKYNKLLCVCCGNRLRVLPRKMALKINVKKGIYGFSKLIKNSIINTDQTKLLTINYKGNDLNN